MCRGFIQGLAHNALHLLRFCSDVQQIPPQTWLSCCIKAEHQWGCTSPYFLVITSRFCWVLHLLPVVRRDGLNLSLNGKEKWVWPIHFIFACHARRYWFEFACDRLSTSRCWRCMVIWTIDVLPLCLPKYCNKSLHLLWHNKSVIVAGVKGCQWCLTWSFSQLQQRGPEMTWWLFKLKHFPSDAHNTAEEKKVVHLAG